MARILYGLALTALTCTVVWIGWHQANPPVTSTVVRFRVIPDLGVEVTFMVARQDGREALCIVRARNRYGEETGRKEVVIPSGERHVTHTEVLRTKDTPVTGEVQDCRLTGT